MLFEWVWGYYFDLMINVIDQYISQFCKKIDQGFDVKLIYIVCGVGYVFCFLEQVLQYVVLNCCFVYGGFCCFDVCYGGCFLWFYVGFF